MSVVSNFVLEFLLSFPRSASLSWWAYSNRYSSGLYLLALSSTLNVIIFSVPVGDYEPYIHWAVKLQR